MSRRETIHQLFLEAVKAQRLAHAPYSGLRVGAAILGADGGVFRGANIENASYGLSMCAERVAVATALMAGQREWKALVVVFSGGAASAPCGACRQILCEFGSPNMLIAWGTDETSMTVSSLRRLLPLPFEARRDGKECDGGDKT